VALLFTPAMQLRARPEAARIRSTNRNKARPIEGKSVKFFIDYAPEDGRYADDLRRGLEKYGHQYVEDGVKPEAVFVLLSAYKKNTSYVAGQGMSLFPVIIQATEVDRSLGKLQWLDFRRGISSANFKKIAYLLPQPTELVKVLAVPPTGRLEIFPSAVNALQYFYLVTGILSGGSLLTSLLSLAHLMFLGKLQADYFIKLSIGALQGVLLFGAVLYSLRGIRSRASGAASAYPLFALFLFQGLLHLFIYGTLSDDAATSVVTLADVAVDTTLFSILIFGAGFVSLLPFLLFGWKDLYRWLPRTFTKGDWLENTFLLYSPDGFGKTIIHVLFHSTLFLVLFLITISNSNRTSVPSATIVFPVVLAIFFHWLARRRPKAA